MVFAYEMRLYQKTNNSESFSINSAKQSMLKNGDYSKPVSRRRTGLPKWDLKTTKVTFRSISRCCSKRRKLLGISCIGLEYIYACVTYHLKKAFFEEIV